MSMLWRAAAISRRTSASALPGEKPTSMLALASSDWAALG
jgi:hypothetical protein